MLVHRYFVYAQRSLQNTQAQRTHTANSGWIVCELSIIISQVCVYHEIRLRGLRPAKSNARVSSNGIARSVVVFFSFWKMFLHFGRRSHENSNGHKHFGVCITSENGDGEQRKIRYIAGWLRMLHLFYMYRLSDTTIWNTSLLLMKSFWYFFVLLFFFSFMCIVCTFRWWANGEQTKCM